MAPKKQSLRIKVREAEDVLTFEAPRKKPLVELEIPSNMSQQGKDHVKNVTEPLQFVVLKEGPPSVTAEVSKATTTAQASKANVLKRFVGRVFIILVLFFLFLTVKEIWNLMLRPLSLHILVEVGGFLGMPQLENMVLNMFSKQNMVEFLFVVLTLGKFVSSTDKVSKFFGLN